MNKKSPLFESVDPALESEADRRAEEDVNAGRLISHEGVKRWLSCWAAGKPLPRPKVGD
jgi:predicted transcriptional regulator